MEPAPQLFCFSERRECTIFGADRTPVRLTRPALLRMATFGRGGARSRRSANVLAADGWNPAGPRRAGHEPKKSCCGCLGGKPAGLALTRPEQSYGHSGADDAAADCESAVEPRLRQRLADERPAYSRPGGARPLYTGAHDADGDTSLAEARVARERGAVIAACGVPPPVLISDSCAEPVSPALQRWTQEQSVEWHCLALRQAVSKRYVVSYNETLFVLLGYSRPVLQLGCDDRDYVPPHMGTGALTPAEAAGRVAQHRCDEHDTDPGLQT